MDKDQAQMILEKDLANIVAKSKEGKPLTKAERDALAMSTAKDTKQYSINALFDLTGVDRRALGRQLKDVKPARVEGRIKYYDLDEVMAAMAAHEKSGKEDRGTLECKKIRKQVETLDFKLKVARGEYWPADDTRRSWLRNIGNARQILISMPDELAPALAGLPVAEIHLRLVAKMDAVMAALRDGWEDEPNE